MAGPIKRLDHICIAVRDTAQALRYYRDVLGLEVAFSEDLPEEGVRATFLRAGDTLIELAEPLREDCAMARFIARRGEGIQHVCFEVDDLEAGLAELERRGADLLPNRRYQAVEGKRVAFTVHPKAANGVLVELCENAEG
jgi:methylmalonyl-CoA epimerase